LTRVLPTPQAAAISVIMLSGCAIGAGVIACADTATDKAKPAVAINLSIFFSLICVQSPITYWRMSGYHVQAA
jgi:hypothetical protein